MNDGISGERHSLTAAVGKIEPIPMRRAVAAYGRGGAASWGIVHRADRVVIGTCGLSGLNFQHRRAEIAYALARRYWGQGLMTEAVRAVLGYGFEQLGLNRIEARCLAENVASARVMEKVGMSFEGMLRQHAWLRGRYRDLKVYSILREEWTALTAGGYVSSC